MNARRFGPYTLDLENEDKLLFPEDGITKGDLIQYYARVAEHALPHLLGRPLTLRRFPDGIDEEGFFQQQAPEYFPAWIRREPVEKRSGGTIEHVVAEHAAALAYLAEQGTIELHAWSSRTPDLEKPDRLLFDLDPPGTEPDPVSFARVRELALLLREQLSALGLVPFVKTTGSRGLHVVVPLRPELGFDAVRAFANELAQRLVEERPEELTVEPRKEERRGRVYLDTGRNAYGQTAVAPYSVRARRGAPIAAPLEWAEVESDALDPGGWRMPGILHRLAVHPCPWKGMGRRARALDGPQRRLQRS